MKGNLAELAGMGIASEPTLRKWIDEKPQDTAWIIKRGLGKGDAYEINLECAVEAWAADQEEKLAAARARADSIKQLSLDMGLNEAAKSSGHVISFKEQQVLLEIEIQAIKLGKMRQELIPVASVQAAIGDMFIVIAQRGSSFSGRLAKKIDLSREQLNAIDALMRQDRELLADELERMDYAGSSRGDDLGYPPDSAIYERAEIDSQPGASDTPRGKFESLGVGA